MRVAAAIALAGCFAILPVSAVEPVRGGTPACLPPDASSSPCKWQAEVIAAQSRFVASLPQVDQTATGSITGSGQSPQAAEN